MFNLKGHLKMLELRNKVYYLIQRFYFYIFGTMSILFGFLVCPCEFHATLFGLSGIGLVAGVKKVVVGRRNKKHCCSRGRHE